ncbi:PQQ-dependent sugar dehydrogenase [uncultured Flavobacterium sp.]|uniref:PQQ-dependent sugar dehydrogenase n=1 Tax=uncultured Flavobacterium sp. TaxID=165435 RepID=UPI0025FBF340|nr:PQQ-dependent sugar dehydrogenase [uncultured Flavobacterium sp.]
MKTKLFFASLLISGFISAQEIDLQVVAQGLNQPTDIAYGYDDRMFVTEQGGKIKMIVQVEDDADITTFLDLSTLVDTQSDEGGLLGMTFHPEFETNGYFYVNYTNTEGNTVIARYGLNATDLNLAEPNSAVILLTIDQPYANHNGGSLKFGPDGYLYIGMGDGGGAGDPENRAQNINTLLGKMLRIDVSETGYTSPAGNPYLGVDGADEIWATGLRNPWKFSFDRTTGDLWTGDVGQGDREEINHVPSTEAGVNYGWRCYEGLEEFDMSECSGINGFTAPVAQYTHDTTDGGCSITGGYVYRGSIFTNLQGKYVFADFCTNKIGVLGADNVITWSDAFEGGFSTFGEDISGELYVAGRSNGTIYKILDSSTSGTGDLMGGAYTVYPNPAGQEVFVSLKGIGSNASLSIFDIGGKLLVQQNVAEGESRIDTSALGSGIYMMELEALGAVKHHKLVIR